MKTTLFSFIFVIIANFLYAQNSINQVKIDINALRKELSISPQENTVGKTPLSTSPVHLPFLDGNLMSFYMVEYSILPKGVNTTVKTYYGQKTDDASITCRITITKDGLVATIFTPNGVVAIERSKDSSSMDNYNVYLQEAKSFECKIENNLNQNERIKAIESINDYSNGTTLRIYRFAIMVTNEFYAARGGTDAAVNTDVAATINTLNGIYERDLAVRFTLVSPTNPASANVFYLNTATTSGYEKDLPTVHNVLTTVFGTANFDIGHCLHSTGGGVASLSATCSGTNKGRGWSGIGSPNDMFVFAHEVGHQFNTHHTFSGSGGSCSTSNRSLSNAYEPGSGNTIMSYNGLCDASLNITGGKTNYFHTNSLQNMISYIQTGLGSTCPTTASTGNTAPVATAGTYGTIPKSTPFMLTGSGNDAEGDALTYTWEQYDLPVANDVGALGNTTVGVGGYTAANSTTAPLFRTRQSSSPIRSFPSLTYILNNANDPNDTEGEDLPNVSRTMNFRLTVRDNRAGGGGINMSTASVNVESNAGPFLLTSYNTNTLLIVGQTSTVTWSVNNTNVAPINCTNVKISLSTDGGQTFPTVLLASTPNNGLAYITVPNLPTTQGRIKIEAIGNIFFDINNINITISSTCTAEASTISPNTTVSAGIEDATLNLGLISLGTTITSKSGTIATTDPPTTIAVKNNITSNCVHYGNSTFYDIYPIKVATAGTYTFTRTTGDSYVLMTFYNGAYSTASLCTNWVASNATDYGAYSSATATITVLLTAGNYNLVVSGFSSNTPTYPASYTITFNPAVYEIVPNNPYAYTYIIVNNGNIVDFNATADMTNATTYPVGNYLVYGLSYAGSADLSSYVGGSLANFQTALNNGTVCGVLSTNTKTVNIVVCPQVYTLVRNTNDISSGTVTKQALATAGGRINATNIITGDGTQATYAAKSVQLNAGFSVNKGVIFKAEVGGCN